MTIDSGGNPYGPHLVFTSADGGAKINKTGLSLNDKWFHLVGTKNGLELKLFLDGQLISSSTNHYNNGVLMDNSVINFGTQWQTLT